MILKEVSPLAKIAALLLMLLAMAACGSSPDDASPNATANPTTPAPTPAPTESEVEIMPAPKADGISLPEGFSAYAIATGFYRPTSVAVANDGEWYVSSRHGVVERLTDFDGDGVLEAAAYFSAPPELEVTGLLATPDGGLYLSVTGETLLVRDTDGDGLADESTSVVRDLPHGRHQNNGLVMGPGGSLFLTNGTTCDDCEGEDSRSGAILQANQDGSDLQVYATGLRNPYDLAFDGQGRLWATDNGSDEPCATVDELNRIVEGGDYGWPYSGDGCDPFSDGITPTADLGLHVASTGITSYESDAFPDAYHGLFISLWGSYFTDPELPPQVMRATIQETANGPNVTVKPFGTGFQHPIDVAVDRDGSLLVLDYGEGGENDRSGTLYRIVYTG
jgi:glucose/arabinose dehydrogenase